MNLNEFELKLLKKNTNESKKIFFIENSPASLFAAVTKFLRQAKTKTGAPTWDARRQQHQLIAAPPSRWHGSEARCFSPLLMRISSFVQTKITKKKKRRSKLPNCGTGSLGGTCAVFGCRTFSEVVAAATAVSTLDWFSNFIHMQ